MPRSIMGKFMDGLQYGGFSTSALPTGNVFYVCNSTSGIPKGGIAGSDGNDGKSPEKPKATLAGALAQCSNGKDDTVILMSGHVETIITSTQLNIAIQGVNIVGLGEDTDRATLILGTAVGATITISGANATMSNVLVVTNIASTVAITLAAKSIRLDRVEIRDGSASAVAAISVVGGGSNLADRCKLSNCIITTAAGTNGVVLGEIADGIVIDGLRCIGSHSNSDILMSVALTNVSILNCALHNVSATGFGIRDTNTTVTGTVQNTNVFVNHAASTIITAAMSHVNCYGVVTLNAASALV